MDFYTTSSSAPKLRNGTVQHVGIGGKQAGEQKEALQQLLLILEAHGQQPRLQRNSVRQIDRKLAIGEDDLDGAGGGFSLEINDAVNQNLMPALFERERRVGDPLLEPADEVALVDGEFAADADGADVVHEVDSLAFPQAEEGLDVAAPEERDGFGRPRFGENGRKLMNVGGIFGQREASRKV
jgi:hypothetical protein